MGQVLLDPKAANYYSSAFPQLVLIAGTTTPVSGQSFTPASNQSIHFSFEMPADYVSGSPTLRLQWYSGTGQTTGNVRWDGSLAAITPGDAVSVEAKAQATATNTTTTVSGTAKGDTLTTVTLSNTDSLAAGDKVNLQVLCNSASTITGNVILVAASLNY